MWRKNCCFTKALTSQSACLTGKAASQGLAGAMKRLENTSGHHWTHAYWLSGSNAGKLQQLVSFWIQIKVSVGKAMLRHLHLTMCSLHMLIFLRMLRKVPSLQQKKEMFPSLAKSCVISIKWINRPFPQCGRRRASGDPLLIKTAVECYLQSSCIMEIRR